MKGLIFAAMFVATVALATPAEAGIFNRGCCKSRVFQRTVKVARTVAAPCAVRVERVRERVFQSNGFFRSRSVRVCRGSGCE